MSGNLYTRRQLLRGRTGNGRPVLRPPWAVPEEGFTDRCSRCGDCLTACPEGILRKGDGGFPEVDFGRGECTFCGDCLAACETGALAQRTPPWTAKAGIGQACLALHGVDCQICQEQCETRAITFTPVAGSVPRPRLDPGRCTGCGACVAPCPVTAIEVRAKMEMVA
ncbi:MAG: ferredoxin-type protein NapF [Gammaproteobacteria bacterium]|nr:MAG: ferredoxin-type protein NapF [Gammaproteobacteria bacterium]